MCIDHYLGEHPLFGSGPPPGEADAASTPSTMHAIGYVESALRSPENAPRQTDEGAPAATLFTRHAGD